MKQTVRKNLLEALSDNIIVDPDKCSFCGVCVETCILDNLSIEPICVPNHPETEFDEGRFLERLRGSIALARDEKFRIIAAIPKLSQSQIDQVSYILKEERAKLSRLPPKHLLQLQRLEQSYAIQWQEIVDYFHKVVERKLPSAP